MSTVTSSLTTGSIVTRIGMIIGHPTFKDKVMVVVEGNDDKKLYGRLFKKETVQVYPYGGCDKYEILLATLNPKCQHQLMVIKDADFENITGYEYQYPNLFRTDTHDAETMMMTEEFYTAFLAEFLDGDDSKLAEIMKVHDELLPLSWFKLTCRDMARKVDFSTFKLYKFYQGDRPSDIEKCTKILKQKPENIAVGIPTNTEIEAVKSKYGHLPNNQLNNGHDICYGFAYKYKVLNKGKGEISVDSLEKVLRTSYTMVLFSQTKLYSDIKAWADKEGLSLFR
jgi:hypothetical protein